VIRGKKRSTSRPLVGATLAIALKKRRY